MSDIVISVEKLSKKFRIGSGNSPSYHRASELVSGLPRALWNVVKSATRTGHTSEKAEPPNEFWALKDVSFEVKQGEVVGIIGRNGAGKSTLLKILSRITEPTTGRFGIRGRVASLLEVGTGFHPELTGRENIFVSGITLGMTRAEIKKCFDEIVDFSGVEKFLDTPVKHYSSGMQVRLGFAVAAHLESEILIIDEVLAVGDAEFQKKCLSRMGDVATQGRTVLVVTHNMVSVRSLCSKLVWIDKGRVQFEGETLNGINEYNRAAATPCTKWSPLQRTIEIGHSGVIPNRIEILPLRTSQESAFTIESALELYVEFYNATDNRLLNVSVLFSTLEGTTVFASASPAVRCSACMITCQTVIPAHLLNTGAFSVTVLIVENESHILVEIPEALVFEMIETDRQSSWMGTWPGVVRPKLKWTTHLPGKVNSSKCPEFKALGS